MLVMAKKQAGRGRPKVDQPRTRMCAIRFTEAEEAVLNAYQASMKVKPRLADVIRQALAEYMAREGFPMPPRD